jgi:hypothetical protein
MGLDLHEYLLRRGTGNVLEGPETWGARIVEQWTQEGLIGSCGDMSKDSPELARELRANLEAELAAEQRDAS